MLLFAATLQPWFGSAASTMSSAAQISRKDIASSVLGSPVLRGFSSLAAAEGLFLSLRGDGAFAVTASKMRSRGEEQRAMQRTSWSMVMLLLGPDAEAVVAERFGALNSVPEEIPCGHDVKFALLWSKSHVSVQNARMHW